jgi:ElaB/YqjD/DUF883 family membrane-anchored ribosome-binding protein
MTTDSRAAAELEREIAQTRAHIDVTLEAIQEKLSPGRLLDRALDYTKENGGAFAGNFGRSVRDNPLPIALLSIGLGWLMLAGGKPRYASEDYAGDSNYGLPAGGQEPIESGERMSEQVSGAADAGKDAARGVAGGIRDAAAATRDRIEVTRHRTADAAERIKDRASQATASAGHFVEENPLVIGALAIAAGAALGALLPTTRREAEWMGSASDRVRDIVGGEMREMAGAAKSVAERAAGGESGSAPAAQP